MRRFLMVSGFLGLCLGSAASLAAQAPAPSIDDLWSSDVCSSDLQFHRILRPINCSIARNVNAFMQLKCQRTNLTC